MRARHATAIAVAAAAMLASGAGARGQTAELRMDRQAYAGLPFVVAVVVEGFDESPEPEQPPLTIDGADVRPMGVAPNVSSGVRIVNGRRTSWQRVTYVMRYRVEAARAGTLSVPALTVEQGARRARTQPARIEVQDIPTTSDMKLALVLPARPVWAGETVPVYLDWLVRKDVADQQLVVPLFDREDWLRVSAPDPAGRNTLAFEVGSQEIELPLEQSRVTDGGAEFARIRFTAMVTPIQAGRLEVEPSAVVAKLKIGAPRRSVFDRQRVALFKAVDVPRVLEVKPLPLAGQPPGFAGAVGSSFSIAARASRSVVKLGEPVEIAVTVRSDQRLDGVRLPDFASAGALDPSKFAVPEEAPVGALDNDEGTSKTFQLVVQIKDPSVRQLPALDFSFFDPETGTYRTVSSEAIAMQVEGAAIVGAGDVVSTSPGERAGGAGAVSVRGAELGLSDEGATLATVTTVSDVRTLVWLLYLIPVLVLVGRLGFLRWRRDRGVNASQRQAHADLTAALAAARKAPARESVGSLTAALRRLARASGGDVAGLVERLETAAFAPASADEPLDAALCAEVEETGRTLAAAPVAPARAAATAVALLVLGAGTAASASAWSVESRLAEARTTYREAMAAEDRDARTKRFASAEALFRELVAAKPDRPELLTDWGNAALGAGDRGHAVLGFRRALRLDPGLARARANLEWTRGQLPSWLPAGDKDGAVDSLFFWHQSMPLATRHLVGGAGFALALLLVTPLFAAPRRRRLARRLALLPAALWLAMVVSIAFEPDRSRDAVVIADAEILRAADSIGAPAALANPLPGGTEVTIDDARADWIRVALADGTRGWLPARAVARVQGGETAPTTAATP